MTGRPAITVIMPTYQRARLVTAAIASVMSQSLADWQLIVVDDGSTDGTDAAIAPLLADRRIRYLREPHQGQSAARNCGLAEARAEKIAFLDSDNLFYPTFLAAAVAALDSVPDAAAIYGVLASRDHGMAESGFLIRPFDPLMLKEGNFVDLNTIACRRDVLLACGGFDGSLAKLEDWDLLLRLAKRGPLIPIPNLAVYYRILDSGRISDTVLEMPAQEAVRRKHGLARL
jgi:glycosyltransferase involved in cell wall biosynthesis